MAAKACGSCKSYGDVQIVPGDPVKGCKLHERAVNKATLACEDHAKKKGS